MYKYKKLSKYACVAFLLIICICLCLNQTAWKKDRVMTNKNTYSLSDKEKRNRVDFRSNFSTTFKKLPILIRSNENGKYFLHPAIDCLNINILSVVKSSPKNIKLRSVIRNTWGKESVKDRNRFVFSLGRTNDTKLQEQIDEEAKRFQDILQSNFIDSYYNLTIKTQNGVHWIAQFCSDAHFVLLVDDDVIVNFKMVEKFFSRLSHEETKSLFTGFVVSRVPPYRSGSKFAISVKEYPLPYYPPYVSGPVVLTTAKVLQMFDKEIPNVKRFPFEDVFLGMVAKKLNIKITPKYNSMFDHMGRHMHNIPCYLATHPNDIRVTPEWYEQTYKKLENSVCMGPNRFP